MGPEAQNLHVHVRIFYYVTWDYQKKSKISNEEDCWPYTASINTGWFCACETLSHIACVTLLSIQGSYVHVKHCVTLSVCRTLPHRGVLCRVNTVSQCLCIAPFHTVRGSVQVKHCVTSSVYLNIPHREGFCACKTLCHVVCVFDLSTQCGTVHL